MPKDKARRAAAPDHDALPRFTLMAMLRAADDAAVELSRTGVIGPYFSSRGTEAVLAGVAAATDRQDWLLPGRRQSGVAIARGASLVSWAAQLLGRSADPTRGRQAPGHLGMRSLNVVPPSSLPGRCLPQATGVARAMRSANRHEVAVALAGQVAVADGDFHVGLNFAAVWDAPVVFVVLTDDRLGEATASEDVACKAAAYGMPGARVDGGDVTAVEAVVHEAVRRAREGQGPTLVEARCPSPEIPSATARSLRLVGADAQDSSSWTERDPVERAAAAAVRESGEEAVAGARELVARSVREAVERALALEPVPPDTLLADVFGGHRA